MTYIVDLDAFELHSWDEKSSRTLSINDRV